MNLEIAALLKIDVLHLFVEEFLSEDLKFIIGSLYFGNNVRLQLQQPLR